MKPFWMVYLEGGDPPCFEHKAEEDAKREAERLAKKYPGRAAYVLKAVSAVQLGQIVWDETLEESGCVMDTYERDDAPVQRVSTEPEEMPF